LTSSPGVCRQPWILNADWRDFLCAKAAPSAIRNLAPRPKYRRSCPASAGQLHSRPLGTISQLCRKLPDSRYPLGPIQGK
jgi:hypothetical protein